MGGTQTSEADHHAQQAVANKAIGSVFHEGSCAVRRLGNFADGRVFTA
jgi:hypothetical protein